MNLELNTVVVWVLNVWKQNQEGRDKHVIDLWS